MIVDQALRMFELNNTATMQDVKIKYRELAKLYHPDINKHDLEYFKMINEAYSVLLTKYQPKSDPKNYEHIYRILEDDNADTYAISIPKEVTKQSKPLMLHIFRRGIEFIVRIDNLNNIQFPYVIKIKNVTKKPFGLKIHLDNPSPIR